jgi:hypothetical protein
MIQYYDITVLPYFKKKLLSIVVELYSRWLVWREGLHGLHWKKLKSETKIQDPLLSEDECGEGQGNEGRVY